jgi:hypothetical protein
MKLNRQFASPWPAVLVEMKDFVELARLTVGGGYRQMRVSVLISRTVPLESLTSQPVEQFRQWLESVPRCQKPDRGFFATHGQPFHRIDIEIER